MLKKYMGAVGLALAGQAGFIQAAVSDIDSQSLSFRPYFEENVGQFDENTRYLTQNTATRMNIADQSIWVDSSQGTVGFSLTGSSVNTSWENQPQSAARIEYLYRKPVASNASGDLQAVNLSLITQPMQSIRARQIYAGIDLVYRFQNKTVEMDYVVAPGADYQQIRLQALGGKMLVDSQGQLHIVDHGNRFVQKAPFSWQVVDGKRKVIESSWRLLADGSATFELAPHDSTRELVIDPVIVFSGFIGGADKESIRSVKLDSLENIIIAGSKQVRPKPDPAVICYQNRNDDPKDDTEDFDAYVAKYDNTGSLLWEQTLVGSCNEGFRDVYIDASNNIYLTGITVSEDLPIVNQIESVWTPGFLTMDDGSLIPLPDGIFAVYDSAGGIQRASYFGGSGGDYGRTIIADDGGVNIWISGHTTSSGFFAAGETIGASQPAYAGESDAFLMQITGNTVTGTYLGGNNDDFVTRMVRDTSTVPATFWLTGITQSASFPMPGTGPSYREYSAGSGQCGRTDKDLINDKRACQDAYIVNLSEDFSTINKGTFIGGEYDDGAVDIAVLTDGVYLLGATDSGGVILDQLVMEDSSPYDGSPIPRIDSNNNDNTLWLARYPLFKPLKRLVGSNAEYDGLGDTNTQEVFLTKFNLALDKVLYSTFLHGSDTDAPVALKVVNKTTPNRKEIYVLGQTESTDFFPRLASLQDRPTGNVNFFTRLIESDALGRLCAVPATAGGAQEDASCPSGDDGMFSILYGSEATDVPHAMVTSVTNSYTLLAGVVLSGATTVDYPATGSAPSLNSSFSGGLQDIVLTRIDHGGSAGHVDISTSFTQQGTGSVTTGSEVDYRVEVSMISGPSIDNTRIVIQRPLSVSITWLSPACRQVNTYLYCDTGTLDGATPSKEIAFTVRARYRSNVSLTATAHSTLIDSDLRNNTVITQMKVIDKPNRAAVSPYSLFLLMLLLLFRQRTLFVLRRFSV